MSLSRPASPPQRLVRSAVAILLGITVSTPAFAYSDRLESACKDDYFRFCAAYPVNSAALRLCMESKADQLSRTCVRALIDSGQVDRRRLKR